MELLIYVAKLSAYWIALYILYALFLRHHTFLRWNRTYLLGSLVLSFALPLVQYPESAPPMPVVYQVSAVSFSVVTAAPSPSLLTWENLVWLVYGIGVVVMSVRLVQHFRHLNSFLQEGECIPMDHYTLVLLGDNQTRTGSFSFMKWIFISPADYAHNFDTILSHELAHVRQRHSWDILFLEILQVVFWFNPILIIYKKTIQQVHEYLADRQAVQEQTQTDNRDRYAEFLVSYALGAPASMLTNQFFNSKLLKPRIAMLYKNKNSKWSLGKYAAVALLVGFASLMVASCEREVMPTSANGEAMVKGDINITGIVNTPDHKPLRGAVITDSKGKKGAITDEAGRFSLKVPAGSALTLSHPDYGQIIMGISGKYKNTDYDLTMPSKGDKPSNMVSTPSADGQSVKITGQTSTFGGSPIFTVVEKAPEFPGGIQAMYKFLGENIKYPEAAAKANVQGKVFLTFIVTSEGEIKDIQIMKGLGFGADQESVRVMSKMPRWEPGMQSGRPVNVRYNLPIAFQLDNTKEIKANESAKKVGLVEQGTLNGPSTEGPTMIYTGVGQARVVIDGVMQKEGYDIKEVGPDNVQKVNVLKGESATKAYGEKGANGVIEIYMKKK
ncbi:TonB family protein [Salmonirosea aquatica]